MFFAMPNEIQVQILCYLDASDILSLRTTSKRVLELLQINASVISRLVLRHGTLGDDPIYEEIYRPPLPVLNLDHLLQMMHRERIVMRMVSTIADYVQTKIYQVKSASRRRQFAPSRSRMERRLKASAFITYHFLEKFRADLLCHMEEASSSTKSSLSDLGSADVEIQTRIINGYPEDTLLPAFQFYRIMVSAYRQKLRPPTYAGTIERKIRGWDRTPASDADVTQVLIYGGMEEVLRIMLHPTYGARLQALNLTIDRINSRSLPVGSRWMEGKSKPKVIRDLDIPPISDIQFMSQGSTAKLTTLYLPWLWAIVAKRRAREGTESSAPDPQIPSPFAYIEDLLKDHVAGAIPAGIGVTVEDFAARANAPDEDEEHTDETAAGPADTLHAAPTQHRSLSFPTQFG
jgi:F-box domain